MDAPPCACVEAHDDVRNGVRSLVFGGHDDPESGHFLVARDDFSCPLQERVQECTGDPMGRPLRTRLVAARATIRSRDPVEVRVRDGVLSEKEAHLGRMFLDVAHSVELHLQKADGLPR